MLFCFPAVCLTPFCARRAYERTVAVPTHRSLCPAMGKAGKKKKNAARRFDPLARSVSMQVDSELDPAAAAPKALSAHQQRHLERKRLQAEARSLKDQRKKVSKADSLNHKREKKSITKSLRSVKEEAARLRARLPTAAAADEASPAPLAADALANFSFDLPMPGS